LNQHRPLTRLFLALLAGASFLLLAPQFAGAKAAPIPPLTPDAVTHHRISIDGRTLAYTARAGTITLRNGQDQLTARVFYTAYTLDVADPARRPVTFLSLQRRPGKLDDVAAHGLYRTGSRRNEQRPTDGAAALSHRRQPKHAAR
jgi:hypothetical protein